jgi:hypothetical protein
VGVLQLLELQLTRLVLLRRSRGRSGSRCLHVRVGALHGLTGCTEFGGGACDAGLGLTNLFCAVH